MVLVITLAAAARWPYHPPMRNRFRHLSALTALALALPAAGQDVAKATDAGGWIAIVIAIVLVVGILVGSFMSSRRTHQD